MIHRVFTLLALAALALAVEFNIKTTHMPDECKLKSRNGDRMAMHYTGTLDDGSEFDSSRDRGRPFEFTIGQGMVIQGWEQGLLDMCIGEKRILTIPHEMGYGKRGHPPVIPAEATLTFDVELLELKNRREEL